MGEAGRDLFQRPGGASGAGVVAVREHRFFVPAGGLCGSAVRFDPQDLRHMRVLRLRPGDRVVAVVPGLGQAPAVLEALGPEGARGRLAGGFCPLPEPPVELWLFQAVARGTRMELVVEKGTELGVAGFAPFLSRRCPPGLGRGEEKRGRWARVAREAARQCGRGAPPELVGPLDFASALARAALLDLGLLLHPDPAAPRLCAAVSAWLQSAAPSARRAAAPAPEPRPQPAATARLRVAVLVGPEGGFEAAEVEAARSAGLTLAWLGPRTLRTETAGVVAAALLLHALGDLG
ncbi:MAG: 16S rRNA (uracil(1498)-N(3))-methyltransferase [Acetobacteraceae bacterium]|nr:16S rRNA (uracil(1498)-N(3))-methyltransferase [Acetobacteraceae bacterium]